MKSLKLLALPFLLLSIFVIQSCEKDQSLVDTEDLELAEELDCFFTNDCIEIGNAKSAKKLTPFTDVIKQYYKDHPSKKTSIKASIGTPYWEHSIDWSGDVENILYIPLIKKNKVNGFLIAFQKEGMPKPKFKALKLSKIKKLPIIKDKSEKLKFIDQAHALIFVLRFQQQIEGAVDCDLVSTLKKIEGKGKNISSQKNCWIETDEVFTCLKALIGGVWHFQCDGHIEYDLVCDESGSGEPEPGPDPDPEPNRGGPSAPRDPGGEEEDEQECEIGYVWDAANGECVEDKYYFDVNGDPVTWCENSFNPLQDKTGSLWITQMALTTAGKLEYSLLRRNECVSQISIQVPKRTWSGIEISDRITKVLIREAITSATEDLTDDLRFNENTDCDFRSNLMQERFNSFLQRVFKDEFNRGDLSTEFRGVKATVRNEATHSQWIHPDIPWRWLESDHFILGCKFTGKDHYN